ncbi:MAG: diguanylate cyclase [Gammaproteobacteria bacterium HGW-Gammaproteobacteria-10]|nr:MAG: diguanylate cyclase [Gammaproteobacteria bacterium HGW-Gammaproteobacteria-10]
MNRKKPVNLLLVEDDLADQMSFKRFVKQEQLPYDYTIAGSVAEAVDLLKKQTFEIVLADHALGDGTAFDIVDYIPMATPIIFVTGSGNEAVAVKALKLGAADYLTKDLNGEYLHLIPITIDNVLKAKAVEAELESYRRHLEKLVEERTAELRLEIDYRKRAEERLMQEKERAQVTLKSIGDAVIVTGDTGLIEFINPAAEKLTEWRHAEALGRPIDEVFHIIDEKTRKPLPNPVAQCLSEGESKILVTGTVLIDRLGREYAIQDSAAPIRGEGNEIQGVVLVFSDVSHARRLSRELAYQASHDPLTGLVNRREFETRLNRVLQTRKVCEDQFAFCYLDLDQFKVINDTCGHTAGDELLKQVTSLLQRKVRKRDTLARLGGDEFGVLMEHCGIEQAERLADELREIIADYRFNWNNQSFHIGVSIGLMAITEEFICLNDLLMVADASCYAAKDAGRNRVFVYQKNDEEIRRLSGQMQWVAKLNDALDHKRFQLYRQPICATGTQNGEHYEILVRILSADREVILPGAFIPAAERYGLMSRIDEYIIENTLLWFAEHSGALADLSMCSINLSGQTLGSDSAQLCIQAALKKFKLPADRFCFEVTETAAIANLNQATRFMGALKTLGCRFALDDFGSGLSSFAYLKNLPVDFLKIDGMFVKDICCDPVDLAMVKSINEIGHLLGKQTIAEFVETEEIYLHLLELGVDYAQGFWLGRPEPLGE